MPPQRTTRLGFLDLLRALASQVIAWHHFVIYGPLPVAAAALAPRTFAMIDDYGRMAVQVFLVIGGFLAARSLASAPPPGLRALGRFVWHRYRRTGIPGFVALLLVLAVTEAVRGWIDDPRLIAAPPSVAQLAAHALFLQYVLGYEGLAPGLWYLAVDLQLAVLTLLVYWAGGLLAAGLRRWQPATSGPLVARGLFAGLAVASLLGFNRDSGLEDWAIYFFASWFLGMALHWALAGELPRLAFWAYLALVLAAACWDWRPRLLVASGTALAIVAAHRLGQLDRDVLGRPLAFLGRISFSLFLVHFSVSLAVNATFWHLGLVSPWAAMAGLWLAYAGALLLAIGFHRFVELPAARGGGGRRAEKASTGGGLREGSS